MLTTIIFSVSSCAPNDVSLPQQLKLQKHAIKRPLNSGEFRDEVRVVRVVAGDTIYSIAKRHGVTPRHLIIRNNLSAPYKIRVGQSLELPIPKNHVVTIGDTIFALSHRYGVEIRTLVAINKLNPPYQLQIGQVLRIPKISENLNATKRSLIITNNGQSTKNYMGQPFPKPRPSQPQKKASNKLSSANPILSLPGARSGKYFLWPARGRVISRFGPRLGGLHNDGINIAAPKGSPVYAAENGVIAYTGSGLKGFGNLLLVKHAGGWTTAYAHVDKILVRRGDRVKRGETIGTIGSTGKVSRPQLHFEIRKGSRAIDPIKELVI